MGAFIRGDSRINRKGRPKKGTALTDVLNFKLDQKTETGKLRREVIAEKLIGMAESGDIAALRYLMDRIDGRPRETIALENDILDIKLKELFNEK
jgi:hypothetical protein